MLCKFLTDLMDQADFIKNVVIASSNMHFTHVKVLLYNECSNSLFLAIVEIQN